MLPGRVFEVAHRAEAADRHFLWLGEDLSPEGENEVLISQELIELPVK